MILTTRWSLDKDYGRGVVSLLGSWMGTSDWVVSSSSFGASATLRRYDLHDGLE